MMSLLFIDVFKVDPEFQENEDRYKAIKEEILGEGSSDEEGEVSGSETDDSEVEEAEGDAEDGEMKIIDETQTDLMGLRRTIYLTIMSRYNYHVLPLSLISNIHFLVLILKNALTNF